MSEDLIDRFNRQNRAFLERRREKLYQKWEEDLKNGKATSYFNSIMGKCLTSESFNTENKFTLVGTKPSQTWDEGCVPYAGQFDYCATDKDTIYKRLMEGDVRYD